MTAYEYKENIVFLLLPQLDPVYSIVRAFFCQNLIVLAFSPLPPPPFASQGHRQTHRSTH